MTDYAAVLTRRHSGREWILNGDDYDGLIILDGGPKPTKKSLDDAWPEVKNEIEAEASAKVSTRQSALAKLAALGLTEAEISAIIGA